MTVRELINELENFDDNTEIVIAIDNQNEEYTKYPAFDINDIVEKETSDGESRIVLLRDEYSSEDILSEYDEYEKIDD